MTSIHTDEHITHFCSSFDFTSILKGCSPENYISGNLHKWHPVTALKTERNSVPSVLVTSEDTVGTWEDAVNSLHQPGKTRKTSKEFSAAVTRNWNLGSSP